MSSFCPPSVLSYTLWMYVCTTVLPVDQQIKGKGQVLWLGGEEKGRRQVLDSLLCHKLPVWSWLSHLVLAEGVMAELWQRSRHPSPWWRWDAGDWQMVKHQCHGWATHLPTWCSLSASVELLTLLSGMKYHSSCDYRYQGTPIPVQRGCTRVWRWILFLWQKVPWSINIETISKRLAAARMESQKFPEEAADSWALPPC